jgi:hypothetical protein
MKGSGHRIGGNGDAAAAPHDMVCAGRRVAGVPATAPGSSDPKHDKERERKREGRSPFARNQDDRNDGQDYPVVTEAPAVLYPANALAQVAAAAWMGMPAARLSVEQLASTIGRLVGSSTSAGIVALGGNEGAFGT